MTVIIVVNVIVVVKVKVDGQCHANIYDRAFPHFLEPICYRDNHLMIFFEMITGILSSKIF